MQPYPRALDLVWPGYLHGTGCLSARAMGTGFPTLVWCLCFGPGCIWARVSAAPSHSWLGCWDVCVFFCALRLYPATPGWVVRRGCVCLGSGFGCAPPLLAGVLGMWVFVCLLRLYPAIPGWAVRRGCVCLGSGLGCDPATPGWGVGVCVCSCVRSACTPPLLAGLCGVGVCARAPVSAAPRHSWLGCWGVCVFVCPLLLYRATPGWGVWCGCVFELAFWLPPCHSWLGCWGVCVFVCPLRLYPATPGWGVWCVCVCLGSDFGCAPQLLAGVLVCVCVSVPALLVPRHSWLGCAACVCVCLGSGLCCTPPLLAGVLECVCMLVSPPRLYPATPGRAVGVCLCVLGLRFWLRHATPGWGVRVCVCSCACSACSPPHLAGVCGVGVCVWARVSAAPRHSWPGCWGVCVCLCARSACSLPQLAGVCGVGVCAWARVSTAPRHSWLGCSGVCVFVYALRLYPATPGRDVWCGCVCLSSGFSCAPPLPAGVLGCVCVCVPPLLVPRYSWLGCVVWVFVLGLELRLRPATPGWGAGVCVCVCVRAPPVPRHSWLGCLVWLCVLGLGFWLRPATPAWGVGVSVCLCARSACTPPLLAGVCGDGVCAWARVAAASRQSQLGCWGVCVFVCALRLYPVTPGSGVWCGCVCLGSGFGCDPPLLAGVLGCVRVCVRLLLAPCHSWHGFVVCGLAVA